MLNTSITPDANHIVTLSGLEAGTEYVYTLSVQNVIGGSVYPLTTKPLIFRTSDPNDAVGPQILSNQVVTVMAHRAFLRVEADEPLVRVVVTLTPAGGNPVELIYFTPQDGDDLMITGLDPETEYSYSVKLVDFSGNETTTSAGVFTTSILDDNPAKIVHHAPVDIQTSQVKIRLEADEPLSRVIFKLLPADTLVPQELEFGSSLNLLREFTLTGLRPEVDYYYLITVIDASGNITQTANYGEFHTRII